VHSVAREYAEEGKISTNGVGVKSFALSPNSNYICWVDEDGTAMIYQLTFGQNFDEGGRRFIGGTFDHSVVNVVSKSVARASVDESVGCKMAWCTVVSPSALLALPSTDGTIVLLHKQNAAVSSQNPWEETLLVTSGGSTDINMVEFSADGKYLLSANAAGVVAVWKMDHQHLENSCIVHTLSAERTNGTKLDSYLSDISWCRGDVDVKGSFLALSTAGSARGSIFAANSVTILDDEEEAAAYPVNATQFDATQIDPTVSFPRSPGSATKAAINYSSAHFDDVFSSEMYDILLKSPAEKNSPSVSNSANHASLNISASLPAPTAPTTALLTVAPAGPARKKLMSKSNTGAASKRDANESDDDEMLFDEQPTATSSSSLLRPVAGAVVKGSTATGAAVSVPSRTVPVAEASATAAIVDSSESIAAIKAMTMAAPAGLIDAEHLLHDEDEVDDDDYEAEDYDNVVTGLVGQTRGVGKGGILSTRGGAAVRFAEGTAVLALQPAFQPSTTTVDDKKRRYLVWNSIGEYQCTLHV
jgi:WD40 repeat protein